MCCCQLSLGMSLCVPQWGRSTVSRVFRGWAGPRWVGCSAVGQVHGEYGVRPWGRSTVRRVFRGEAGPRWVGCYLMCLLAFLVPVLHSAHVKRVNVSCIRDLLKIYSKEGVNTFINLFQSDCFFKCFVNVWILAITVICSLITRYFSVVNFKYDLQSISHLGRCFL